MNITEMHKQIMKDVDYIESTYGALYDYCGGWCNNESLNIILKKPNKKTSVNLYYSLLLSYIDSGYDNNDYMTKLPINEDLKLREIFDRWNINTSEERRYDGISS